MQPLLRRLRTLRLADLALSQQSKDEARMRRIELAKCGVPRGSMNSRAAIRWSAALATSGG